MVDAQAREAVHPHVFALPYGAGPSWCGHDGACSVGAVFFFRVVFFAGEGGASGACPVVTSGHLLSTSLAREMLSVLGEPSGFRIEECDGCGVG